MSNVIIGRGRLFCRGCNSNNLFSAIDLGVLPIANELPKLQNSSSQSFPLHLFVCEICGLGQVEDVVTPQRLFEDYRYLSSVSDTFLAHARNHVTTLIEKFNVTKRDWILEIASNDGYLLSNFVNLGIPCLGVEPSQNVSEIARGNGVPTTNDFFSSKLAEEILEERGSPRIIIANNVLAHVPDIQDFIRGISILADSETIITVENPSVLNILTKNQFDTIYHEHYSYLSAKSILNLCEISGLTLFEVEEISTHGGSNRYWLTKSNNYSPSKKVQDFVKEELALGLISEESWQYASSQLSSIISEFYEWLKNANETGKRVFGYGAAAKASTLVNLSKIEKNWIISIADKSREKQSRFMPSLDLPIISVQEMKAQEPTDIVIFPWNIAEEIASELIITLPKARLWKAIPRLERLA